MNVLMLVALWMMFSLLLASVYFILELRGRIRVLQNKLAHAQRQVDAALIDLRGLQAFLDDTVQDKSPYELTRRRILVASTGNASGCSSANGSSR